MKTFPLKIALGLFASTAAFADIYVPEGPVGSVLHLSSAYDVVDRIEGLADVHGMAVAPKRGILITGSLTEVARDGIAKPAVVSEDDHAAHHGGSGAEVAPGTVSLVSIVDAKTHEVLRRIEVPGIVHHVAVSSDERWAIVTHSLLDSVSIIDLDSGEVTATIVTGPVPEYAAADSITGRFFVSNAGNATISDVDPASAAVLRSIRTAGGPKHMRLLSDQRQLVVAAPGPGTVQVFDADSGAQLASYTIGGDLHGIEADADAIYVSARGRGQVVRIDRASGTQTEAAIGPAPYHMTLTKGDLLVSSSAEPVLWVIDADSLALKQSITTADMAHQIVVAETE
ncbi:YncE family protein [Phaeovulum sp.]|uniref:YncE family protein n=1 Tax=Phaeovulum sp. TaxID=2934796 RepID=UPI00356522A0